MLWQKYEKSVCVIGIKYISDSVKFKLMKLIIDNCDSEVFSLIKSQDETTIIVDSDKNIFNPDECIYFKKYSCYILLDTGSLIEESGLLKKVSLQFSENNIPVMYETTVNNNYIYIPIEFDDKVANILQNNLVDY